MLKRHLSLAVALSLACGLAFAEPEGARQAPVAVIYYAHQDLADASGPRLVSAVYLLPTLEDYRHPAIRSDMRVASAGMVFQRIREKDTTSGIGWL